MRSGCSTRASRSCIVGCRRSCWKEIEYAGTIEKRIDRRKSSGHPVRRVGGAASAGKPVTYRGTGSYVLTRAIMPLANGDAVMHLIHDTIATIEPSESGFIYGDCAGLAHLSVENEYSSQFFCTFTETGGDSFDLRGRDEEDSASVEIIGGSGKWAGATGAGTWKRKWGQDNRGTYEYEIKITTP